MKSQERERALDKIKNQSPKRNKTTTRHGSWSCKMQCQNSQNRLQMQPIAARPPAPLPFRLRNSIFIFLFFSLFFNSIYMDIPLFSTNHNHPQLPFSLFIFFSNYGPHETTPDGSLWILNPGAAATP